MVAEKSSIAESIASALSKPDKIFKKQGVSKYLPIYTFTDNIFGKRAYFKVTSVAGHVYQRDFTTDKRNWDDIDPYDLFDSNTVKIEANHDTRVTGHLQQEAKGADYLVLWLDNDREGENICFEV